VKSGATIQIPTSQRQNVYRVPQIRPNQRLEIVGGDIAGRSNASSALRSLIQPLVLSELTCGSGDDILSTKSNLSEVTSVPRTITQLGPKEAEFLSRMAAFERGIFTSATAAAYWGSPTYTRAVLHELTKKGWIARLKRGTYLVIPLEAGPERSWSEQAVVVAQYLVHPAAVAYWSALHHWHLTEQVPRVTFVQTPIRRSRREVEALGMHFRLVTVAKARFFGLVTQDVGGRRITVTDREKTLIDAADRPELSGGIVQLAEALRQGARDIDWPRLDAHLARFGVGTIYKRLGYLVETLDIGMPHVEERLATWRARLTKGISPLEPGGVAGGPTVTRWRIRVNVRGLEKRYAS